MKAHRNLKTAQPNKPAVTPPKSTPPRIVNNHDESIRSIMIMQTEPFGGLWKGKAPFALSHRWHLRDGKIDWEPFIPSNAHDWGERINALAKKANQRRQTGAFLRLSKTSQTRTTWSLPAIAACPVRDETCEHCYALDGWYRVDHSLQIDRALRLEYLKRLIKEGRLEEWVEWMVSSLKALPPDEPFPQARAPFNHRGRVQYFRWHDSGDLFHAEYAKAILKICEATPQVAHWLPTRMSGLVRSLVQQGVLIPPNLSILVSVQRGGTLEQSQIQAVQHVLKAQPSARIGLSYFVIGSARRKVDLSLVRRNFGHSAVVCPAITAQEQRDRVCAGCRRCWAANIESPIIYPKI